MKVRAAMNTKPIRLPLGPTGFARVTGVSRETLERLQTYVGLLEQWNRRINLVGRNTMGDVWRRHILDSAQLLPLLPARTRVLVDLGSGAGLPGLVLAIMGVPEVHLVESDQRKAAFLREAMRVTGTPAILHVERAEKLAGIAADVVTARALASMSELLDLAANVMGARSLGFFLKGETAAEELEAARAEWDFAAELIPSRAEPAASIVKLQGLRRRASIRAVS